MLLPTGSTTSFLLSLPLPIASFRPERILCRRRHQPRLALAFRSRLNPPVSRTIPRCFSTNTDVDVDPNHAASEDVDVFPSIHSDCSVPIVHLKSDILGAKTLKLLETNYNGSLLPTLPALSEEEMDFSIFSEEEEAALRATPAYSAGLYALYATFLAGNFVEQLWSFAWPATVAMIHPSLLPVAVVSFFTKITVFVGGPLVGSLIDSVPRLPAYNCLNIIQTAAQLLSVTMVIHALSAATSSITASNVLLQPWFVILVVAAAVERLSGLALGIMVERDWVVLLAGTSRTVALAQANAMLSRVDLFCEIAGASLFGIVLSKYDPVTCLKLSAGLMICTLPVMVLLGVLTDRLSGGVLGRSKFCLGHNGTAGPIPSLHKIVQSGLDAIRQGWLEYKRQPVLPASVAYVMLNFNIALAPGAMMTAFLTNKGVSPSIIGGFSGTCAFMGVAATFISASLVKKLGILKAGATGLVFQASFLIASVAVLWSGLLSKQTSPVLFLFMIALSRLGHMSYDVVGTQILQTGIPASKANLVGATEVSIASLAEFVMFGVAIIANDISHFGFLAMLSLFSVVGAAWMFCWWLANPMNEQTRLFSH